MNRTQEIVRVLYEAFNTTPISDISSNFPAMAARCEYLQIIGKGAPAEQPTYSNEGPQERNIDCRRATGKVFDALHRLPYATQVVLEKSYTQSTAAPDALHHLAGLIGYSKLATGNFATNPSRMEAIRKELTLIWTDAHRAFEKEYHRDSQQPSA